MGKQKVTSIKVDEDVWNEFKIVAIRRKISVSDLLDFVLRREIKKGVKDE